MSTLDSGKISIKYQKIMEQTDTAGFEHHKQDEQIMERENQLGLEGNGRPSSWRNQSKTITEADFNQKAALSPGLSSPAATSVRSQGGSNNSSAQDIGGYFFPRATEHSVSSDCITALQAPSTPSTDLTGSEAGRDGNLVDGRRQSKAESDSYDLEASKVTWKESDIQTVIGPSTTKLPMTRPTSVPNLNTNPASKRRRDGLDYPVYPDQSFAALQSQQHARPYQPHPLRTRSSHSSHNSSYSSISSRQSRDFMMQSGAKTMGNTPAQSPGLFSPTLPRGRPDDATRTPTLHPSHLQTPTE